MKPHIKEIIDAMEPKLRTEAEAAAAEAGKSLDVFVEESLEAQLTDEQLDRVAGGLSGILDSYRSSPIRGDVRRNRVIIGYGGNF